MSETSSLAEAHEKIQKLTKAVAKLLGVAADDVEDEWDDSTLDGVFHRPAETAAEQGRGSHVDKRIAGRFAQMLVLRLVYEPEIVFGWDDESAQGLAADNPNHPDGSGT